MFCPNCGNKVEDGSPFCPYCGAKLNENNENTSVQQDISMYMPKPKSSPFSSIIKWIKMIFSKNIIKGIKEVANDDGIGGFIGLGLEGVLFALFETIFRIRIYSSFRFVFDIPYIITSVLKGFLHFIIYFIPSLIFSEIAVFALFGLVCLLFVFCKKQVQPKKIAAVLFCSLFLTALGYLVCGLLYVVIIRLGSTQYYVGGLLHSLIQPALYASAGIILYHGIQKIVKFETTPFFFFLLVCVFAGIVSYILTNKIEPIAFNKIYELIRGLY